MVPSLGGCNCGHICCITPGAIVAIDEACDRLVPNSTASLGVFHARFQLVDGSCAKEFCFDLAFVKLRDDLHWVFSSNFDVLCRN